jgi:hypothetical protein
VIFHSFLIKHFVLFFFKASTDPMECLTNMVNNMSIDSPPNELTIVKDSAKKLVTSAANQQEIITMVFKRCRGDWRFTATAAGIFKDLADVETTDDPVKFRVNLLNLLQGDYKRESVTFNVIHYIYESVIAERESLRKDDNGHFLSVVGLLSQTLCQVRLKDGEPFKPLAEPVMDCIMMCLDNKSSDEELECVALQVQEQSLLLK